MCLTLPDVRGLGCRNYPRVQSKSQVKKLRKFSQGGLTGPGLAIVLTNVSDPLNSSGADDIARANALAHRYRCEFVDLHKFTVNPGLLKRIPAELMFRYNFLPLEEIHDGRLAIAIADPSQLMLLDGLDEISLLLGRRLAVRVAILARINEILRGFDPSSSADAPVCVPKKPRPHLRSNSAKAIPAFTAKQCEELSPNLSGIAELLKELRPLQKLELLDRKQEGQERVYSYRSTLREPLKIAMRLTAEPKIAELEFDRE